MPGRIQNLFVMLRGIEAEADFAMRAFGEMHAAIGERAFDFLDGAALASGIAAGMFDPKDGGGSNMRAPRQRLDGPAENSARAANQ
jgi:hypothetical protein